MVEPPAVLKNSTRTCTRFAYTVKKSFSRDFIWHSSSHLKSYICISCFTFTKSIVLFKYTLKHLKARNMCEKQSNTYIHT
jgi:hypothetical protein